MLIINRHMVTGFQKNQVPVPLIDKQPVPEMRLSEENRVVNKIKLCADGL